LLRVDFIVVNDHGTADASPRVQALTTVSVEWSAMALRTAIKVLRG
jgi:hypothetical protein